MTSTAIRSVPFCFLTFAGSLVAADGLKHPFCATYPGSDLIQVVQSREARARGQVRKAATNVKAASVTIWRRSSARLRRHASTWTCIDVRPTLVATA